MRKMNVKRMTSIIRLLAGSWLGLWYSGKSYFLLNSAG